MIEKSADHNIRDFTHEALGLYSELSDILCKRLSDILEKLKISGTEREKLIICINFLAVKDVKTAEHSIRVAILCQRLAGELSISPKPLIYSGLLHDFGKVLVPSHILKKKDSFDIHDMEIMREHPLNTFKLIDETFGFSSNIGLRHHKYQTNGYPSEIPEPKQPFSDKTKQEIDYYSRILSIADFFDAAVSRNNDKFDKCKLLSFEEAIKIMREKSPEDSELINKLSNGSSFKRHMELL